MVSNTIFSAALIAATTIAARPPWMTGKEYLCTNGPTIDTGFEPTDFMFNKRDNECCEFKD